MRSANEISGMVLKAARGAGMPLGCAEDLARAAPALAALGALGIVPDLLGLECDLPRLEGGVVLGGHPILAITAWCDLRNAGVEATLEASFSQELLTAMQAEDAAVGPFEVDNSLWAQLQSYAERTFVPESEASRLAGAGAGLTDND